VPEARARLLPAGAIVCVGPPLLASACNRGSTANTPVAMIVPLPLMPD
jgi:hypothetical protein